MGRKIFVAKKDIENFNLTACRENIVRQYWINIIKHMPSDLRNEVRVKRTDLVKERISTINENLVEVYTFVTSNASIKLLNYLQRYQVLAN